MIVSGVELLPNSLGGPPLAVPGKLPPGVGGWAVGSRTGILVGPLPGDGERADAGSLNWEKAPSALPQGGCLGSIGLAKLEQRGGGDGPLAGVPLAVASGARSLSGVGALAWVPQLSGFS